MGRSQRHKVKEQGWASDGVQRANDVWGNEAIDGDEGGPLQGSLVASDEPSDESGGGGGGTTPVITSLSPNFAGVDNGIITITVNGTGFDATDSVNMDGNPRTTTFVSATQLTAQIPTDGETERNAPITVWSAGTMSNAMNLAFIGG